MVDDKSINLQLWDTAGQGECKILRPLAYPQTDVFVVIFSLVSPSSLDDVENIFVPEIREHCPEAPYILVGTRKSKRDSFYEHEEEFRSKGWEPVSTEDGMKWQIAVKASQYIECDADKPSTLGDIFTRAINVALHANNPEIKTDIYTIGLYGENKDSKTLIALKYICGDFHEGRIPTDEEAFFKVEEVNDIIFKVSIDINNPIFLSKIDGMIFVYDVDVNSIDNLKNLFKSIKDSDSNNIPYILVLNYRENSVSISDDVLDHLISVFKCNVFEIKNYSIDDIEDAFFDVQRIGDKIARILKKKQVVEN